MWDIKDVEEYFYNETRDFNISKTELIETKHFLMRESVKNMTLTKNQIK